MSCASHEGALETPEGEGNARKITVSGTYKSGCFSWLKHQTIKHSIFLALSGLAQWLGLRLGSEGRV